MRDARWMLRGVFCCLHSHALDDKKSSQVLFVVFFIYIFVYFCAVRPAGTRDSPSLRYERTISTRLKIMFVLLIQNRECALKADDDGVLGGWGG